MVQSLISSEPRASWRGRKRHCLESGRLSIRHCIAFADVWPAQRTPSRSGGRHGDKNGFHCPDQLKGLEVTQKGDDSCHADFSFRGGPHALGNEFKEVWLVVGSESAKMRLVPFLQKSKDSITYEPLTTIEDPLSSRSVEESLRQKVREMNSTSSEEEVTEPEQNKCFISIRGLVNRKVELPSATSRIDASKSCKMPDDKCLETLR